jgi:hypothetical protein
MTRALPLDYIRRKKEKRGRKPAPDKSGYPTQEHLQEFPKSTPNLDLSQLQIFPHLGKSIQPRGNIHARINQPI